MAMEMLRRTLVGDMHQDGIKSEITASEVQNPPPKPSRSFLLHSVSTYLLKAYRETPNPDDKVSAEEIHFNVNKSESIKENVSFITASRLVKSTFKNAHYDKDTKFFHGLERVYPDESDTSKERSVKYTQPRWCSTLVGSLCHLHDSGILCDTIIMCRHVPSGSDQLTAHACVLSSASPLLLSKMVEKRTIYGDGGKITIQCDGISYTEWSMILQFIYKGNVDLCLKDAMRMWVVARFLRIQGLVVLLENLMKDNDISCSLKWRNQCIDQGEIIVMPFNVPFSDEASDLSIVNSQNQSKSLDESPKERSHNLKEHSHIMSQNDIRNIAENVINSYNRDSPIPSQTVMPQETHVASNEDTEPKSKRRKMYKPRKVAPKEDANSERQTGLNVIGTVQLQSTPEPMSTTSGEEIAPDTLKPTNESSMEHDSNIRDDDTNFTTMKIKEEPVEFTVGPKGSDVYQDTAGEDSEALECNIQPVVIAPIETAVSPISATSLLVKKESVMFPEPDERGAGDAGSSSGDGSMLFDLLKSSTQQKPQTPMLKSLLALAATQSPNPGMNNQKKTDSESEPCEDRSDPDYKPSSSKKRKKKRGIGGGVGNTIVTRNSTTSQDGNESGTGSSAPVAPSPPPPASTSQPLVLTWSEEDLQRERLQMGGSGGHGGEFSASSLLLSMIDKATPKGETTSAPVANAKQNLSPAVEEPLIPDNHSGGSSATPASNILVSLLGKKNASEKNKALVDKSRSSKSSESSSGTGGLLFSQVLQGMASAYSSPKAKVHSSSDLKSALRTMLDSKSQTSISHVREDSQLLCDETISHSDNESESKKKTKSKKISAKTKIKNMSKNEMSVKTEHKKDLSDSPIQLTSQSNPRSTKKTDMSEQEKTPSSCLETLLSTPSKFSRLPPAVTRLDKDRENMTDTLSHLKSLLAPSKGNADSVTVENSEPEDNEEIESEMAVPVLEPVTDLEAHFSQDTVAELQTHFSPDPKEKQWNDYVKSIMKKTSLS